MKIKLIGHRGNDGVFLSLPKKFRKLFPQYFVIDILIEAIKERKKRK